MARQSAHSKGVCDEGHDGPVSGDDVPFDPTDPAFLAEPYARFAELRRSAEVHWHPGMGMAIAVSHRSCSVLLRDRALGRFFVDAEPAASFPAFNLLHHNSLLEHEPPDHTRLRSLVAAAFGRGHTQRLASPVQRLADELVDELAEQIHEHGRADLLATVAGPLPVAVIAELLGVPEPLQPELRPWSNAIVKMYEYGLDEPRRAAAETAAAEFVTALRELAAHRRSAPADDLVSDLLAVAEADGDRLTEDELVGTAALLLMAGHEATVNTVGNGILALLRDRAQWERLGREPDRDLLATATEELIRFDPPLQLFERTATDDIEIAGYQLRPGQKIAALLGAAARDPAVFVEPDRLDVARHPNPHLGFGAGIHYCLGAPLARVEVAAVLAALCRRLPGLQLAAEPQRRPEFVMRGLRELWVTAPPPPA
ncbi:MAG: cytochrome [Pseudonocardia sp.]|nr:cytochrome [Pseudonocardia sp.]